MNVNKWAKQALEISKVYAGQGGSREGEKELHDEVKTFKDKNIVKSFIKTIAKTTPIKNEDGKYSALKTYQAANEETQDIIRFLTHYRVKSNLYANPDLSHQYGMFTPLFLRAFKEFQQIPYEEWSKEEADKPYIGTGILLWDVIKDFLKPYPALDDHTKELREHMLEASTVCQRKGVRDGQFQHVWKCPSAEFEEGAKINTKVCVIKAQLWIAAPYNPNPKRFRNEFQILDTVNWDLMPEPMTKEIPTVDEIITTSGFTDI